MKEVNAVVIKSEGKHEVRCGSCGKLLLICKFSCENTEISENGLDKSAQNVIIVARCTRSNCKTDNLLFLSQIN